MVAEKSARFLARLHFLFFLLFSFVLFSGVGLAFAGLVCMHGNPFYIPPFFSLLFFFAFFFLVVARLVLVLVLPGRRRRRVGKRVWVCVRAATWPTGQKSAGIWHLDRYPHNRKS
jgi:hypothetical protein